MIGDSDDVDTSKQVALLAESSKKVQEQSFFMKRAIDLCDLSTSIDRAADIIKELRTAALSPRTYYELYMKVVDELRNLEEFFMIINNQGTPMVQLYEHVQACNQVLPRLYLLVTVGGCFIKSKEVPAQEVLSDLVEMCKGVQHPMRGLFLRSYLSHVTKDKLPDTGSIYEGDGGSVQNCIDFIIENFAEANRLWVRMHSQATTKDKKRKERERKELRLLVGMNLVRLSELDGVNALIYKTEILPKVLEQIIICKDTIAQSYLMDCLIQAFPDEFHLYSLPVFLDSIAKLKEKVRVRAILESLMQRLGKYEEGNTAVVPKDPVTFHHFKDCIVGLIQDRPSLDLKEIILLHGSLLEFASRCYPSQTEFVDYCLDGAAQAILAKAPDLMLSDECADAIQRLLLAPLGPFGIQPLFSEQFRRLLETLSWTARAVVARAFLTSLISHSDSVSSPEVMDRLLTMISSLIMNQPDEPPTQSNNENNEYLESDQNMLAKILYLIPQENTDLAYQILLVVRRHFGRGGQHRIKYTLVPLVFSALKLAKQARKIELDAAKSDKIDNTILSQVPKISETSEKPQPQKLEIKTEEVTIEEKGEGNKVPVVVTIPSPTNSSKSDTIDESNNQSNGEPNSQDNVSVSDAQDTTEKDELVEVHVEQTESVVTKEQNDVHSEDESQSTSHQMSNPSPLQFGSRKLFQFVHETVTAMAPLFPLLSLKLFLQCAIAADRAGFPPIAYEFVSQACILYEDDISEARMQFISVTIIAGALSACNGFGESDWEALAAKTAQYAARLLRKPDQCRAVCLCSHLFWGDNEGGASKRDSRRVLECLQRALKIADSYVEGSAKVSLFIEILNQVLYYFENGNEEVSAKFITGLVALIREHLFGMEPSLLKNEAESFFQNTLSSIASKQNNSDSPDAIRIKFSSITL